MLTAKQLELLCFIRDRLSETGVSPSFEEMKEALDLKSKSGVHRLISALEERAFIRRLPNRARALEILQVPEGAPPIKSRSQTADNQIAGGQMDDNVVALAPARAAATPPASTSAANDVLEIPLHGRIAAGMPIEALEGHTHLAVPAALLGPGEHYALEVAGDSMVDAGILDGDYALVRRTESARDGEIVVALIDENEATLKYFRKEGSMVRLDPANRAYDPQRYDPRQVRIQGRLAGLLRRY